MYQLAVCINKLYATGARVLQKSVYISSLCASEICVHQQPLYFSNLCTSAAFVLQQSVCIVHSATYRQLMQACKHAFLHQVPEICTTSG
ncbi:hypothetical protein PAAL66ix_02381 [Paenibacillus alvei A6-6i-x]|nr:hypothetical protein PAAL66ix_02381 [Paenibacillus alvei A6-6i-x]